MKTFFKVIGFLVTAILALKGIHNIINYFYNTYATRYAESELTAKD